MQTGIDIQYSGSKEFEASIRIAVEGGNAPDIVDFPQPGLLANFVAEGQSHRSEQDHQSRLAEAELQPVLAGYGHDAGPRWPDHGRCLGRAQRQVAGLVPQEGL